MPRNRVNSLSTTTLPTKRTGTTGPTWETLQSSPISALESASTVPSCANASNLGHYAQKVVDQYHEALGYGIRGIPTFVFDNLLFSGAQPYEVFQRVMDKALENRETAES